MGDVSYVNGQLVSQDEATVSVTDRGFLFGDGLYEIVRVYGGYPFQLNAHLQRLGWGARKIGFDLGLSLDTLRQACQDTLEANAYKEAVLRVVVTRGSLADMYRLSVTAKPTVTVTCDEFQGYPLSLYDRGVETITVTDGRSDLAMVQTLNCLPNLMARKEAEQKKAFEALLVTKKGFVMSGSSTNVFAVLDGMLLTPPVGDRVPPGITREAVLSAAGKESINVKEDAIMNEEIHDAEEFFLTGTLCEVVPVVSIDGQPVGDGNPGHQTRRLMKAYKLMTRRAY
ncbi:MAG: aminotransferase class IV [Actinomycetota bacterium]